MNKVIEAITELADPIVREAGCTLWDVEYVKEAGQWFLRVYIDKDGGITITDCETVSRALDPILDETDIIPGQYTFEVSSAGAERQLKRERDFAQFIGHLVELKLYRAVGGAKEHVGKLVSYEAGDVTIDVAGEARTFEKNDIALVRLRIGSPNP
ncbi:MAG: ribosome maturation factor RimP [Oscillospiraceae bacterium]|nr:ribosome maturation factor RimP [Oscillospiraceae bacterium]